MKVGIIMGSDSDLKIMKDAAEILNEFGIEYDMTVCSAHRCPDKVAQYAKTAKESGFGVIIAGAGGAAHLAGVIAAMTTLPVIGVPILSKSLGGADSLYSMVQMPSGIPVATVAIDGAKNAGILAAQILGIANPQISEKIKQYKIDLEKAIEKKANRLKEIGYEEYLKN